MAGEVLRIYCDGSHANLDDGTVAAGYGVFAEEENHRVRISEPLCGVAQTAARAIVMSFNSALEVAAALRVANTAIFINSAYVARGFNEWLDFWRENEWCKSNGKTLEHTDLWKSIDSHRNKANVRKIKLTVRQTTTSSSPKLNVAISLARDGVKRHGPPCTYCKLRLGRQDLKHDCKPICRTCNGRVFPSKLAYDRHKLDAHSERAECRRCNAVFGSYKARASHEERVHDSFVFECDYCTLCFLSQGDADQHTEDECDYAPICRLCDRWFHSAQAAQQHARDRHLFY